MDLSRPSLRLLALFGAVAIPPLVALAVVMALEPDWVAEIGAGTALLLATLGGAAWAIVMAWFGSRAFGREFSRLVELAERGAPARESEIEALSATQRRVSGALEERNRQIASLAAAVSDVPISGTPVEVVATVVRTARDVTTDPTWQLAVLRSSAPDMLAPGIYSDDPTESPSEISDLQRWAALAGPGDGTNRCRYITGPWGAFLAVDTSAPDQVSAVMLAPREGRGEPSRAELDLFSLLGLQAATAIDHALLFARVRSQAEELNRMAGIQTDFLRGVTHDLQTPLTSIKALASELSSAPGLGPSDRTDLDTIAHQADRLRRMVSQLLVASRLEAGAVTPSQDVLRVEPVVRSTWEALRADRKLELSDDGPPNLAVADPDRLEQVLWAVLDNAVKYSQPGSTIRIKLAARTGTTDDELLTVIEVADEGMGMDAAGVEHAFDQFYRAADARRVAPDGSGVGLYAARGLMRAMAGDVHLESRLGQGTRVTLILPAEAADSAP